MTHRYTTPRHAVSKARYRTPARPATVTPLPPPPNPYLLCLGCSPLGPLGWEVDKNYTFDLGGEDFSDAAIKAFLMGSSPVRYFIDAFVWSLRTNEEILADVLESTLEAAGRRGGIGPVNLGKEGERKVRAKYNIGNREYYKVEDRNRISDGSNSKVISEVKNVNALGYTQQLKDAWQHAQDTNRDFDLYVRGGENPTILTKELKRMARDNARFHIKEIP